MEQAQRELLVARIAAGCQRFKIRTEDGEERLLLKKPSLENIYIAQEIYFNYLEESRALGCYSEEDVIDWLIDEGTWTEEKQTTLDTVTEQIEDFKVKLYELTFKSKEKRIIRKALKVAKETVAKLRQERASFNYLTSTGAASLLRSRYLIACSVYKQEGVPYYSEDGFWQADPYILDQIVEYYYSTRLEEVVYRELARTEPWRVIWNGKKAEGSVFSVGAVHLSEEQRSLVMWSGIYDSIYEHPECPTDDIIDDDDILDGWMIIQRRKRLEGADKRRGEELVSNEKVRNSGEVFIPVDTMADAKKIDALNDDHARMVKRQRLAFARKRGVVHEAEMPDSMQEIQQELNKKFIDNARGKG